MASVTRDSELASQTNSGTAPATGAKPQPVAVEIPVTVNGARTISGSDKREPFSETTTTVLVFGSGAVIRMSVVVGPGQLLFVTNEKSKKEVVCQVVKSKQNGNGAGYVELRFTEAAADFWGVQSTGTSVAPSAPASGGAVPGKTLEQKLAEAKNAAPSAAAASSQQSGKPHPAVVSKEAAVPPATMPAAAANTSAAAPVAPAPAPAIPPKVPTLSEFLTKGTNGLELKAADRLPAQNGEPVNGAKSGAPVQQPQQLPPATPSPENGNAPGLGAALAARQNPAPGALTFDLGAEEVKIPSWLEPLARNSAGPETKSSESGANETPAAAFWETSGNEEKSQPLIDALPAAESGNEEAVHTLAGQGRAPNFGSSLSLGSGAENAEKSSGKGWKIGLGIVVLLLAAAAVWYWYTTQPSKVSANENSEALRVENAPAPAPNANLSLQTEAVKPWASNSPAESALEPLAVSSRTVSGATGTSRGPDAVASTSRTAAAPEVPAEPAAKKPALGDVRLAAPVVTRPSAQDGSVTGPSFSLSGAPAGNPSGLSMLNSGEKEPAAPLPVGGDVKPARLLSSVPPVYPQLARTQRISGDVTIDALIDARGKVSTMRVVSGPILLHQAAMEAVKQWKYQPAMLNDQPTAMHLTVTVQFRLQ